MHFINCAVFLLVFTATTATAQFHTITKDTLVEAPIKIFDAQSVDTMSTRNISRLSQQTDTLVAEKHQSVPKRNRCKSEAKPKGMLGTPELNIENLRREIRKNRIKYEDIVVAQALLETGNFKSRVCKELNNLFGLTNPRTGKYFEFQHWTESVRAYYTTVQYKYSRKNKKINGYADYLLWLRDIGYAEDPGYIRALIRMLRTMNK